MGRLDGKVAVITGGVTGQAIVVDGGWTASARPSAPR